MGVAVTRTEAASALLTALGNGSLRGTVTFAEEGNVLRASRKGVFDAQTGIPGLLYHARRAASNRQARFLFWEVGMAFVDREILRIEAALSESSEGERLYDQLYAAQQALKWTTEPQGFAAPLDMILRRTVASPTGTPAATAGCSVADRLAPS